MGVAIFTLYKNPADHPGMYVLREWAANDPTMNALILPISDEVLEALRQSLREKGLTCVGRETEDDPVILESWM